MSELLWRASPEYLLLFSRGGGEGGRGGAKGGAFAPILSFCKNAPGEINGVVGCISGPLGMYRNLVLQELLPLWAEQSFLGNFMWKIHCVCALGALVPFHPLHPTNLVKRPIA